jgi:hypothetical protein
MGKLQYIMQMRRGISKELEMASLARGESLIWHCPI